MTTTIAGAQNTLTKLEAFVSDTIDNTVESSDDVSDKAFWKATELELCEGIDALRTLLSVN